jgi:hypothetical protein
LAVSTKTCLVHFTDLQGLRHTTEVTAESLYEAAALAFQAFKKAELMDQMPGPASRFEIEVSAPRVVHEVTVGQMRKWVESGSSDPREGTKKARLAELIGAK